jgi:hypothetical protein
VDDIFIGHLLQNGGLARVVQAKYQDPGLPLLLMGTVWGSSNKNLEIPKRK